MDQLVAVRAFIRVVETGSFTKASDSLELPRNRVTKLIQALEARAYRSSCSIARRAGSR